MGSTRLPGKVLKPLGNKFALEILLARLSASVKIDTICVATSTLKADNILCDAVLQLGIPVYRGSENDVLSRFYEVAKHYEADIIVRITGDCPLIDPTLVTKIIDMFEENNVDYVSNINPPTFPDGLDVEVFSFKCLRTSHFEATSTYDREHVTPYMRAGAFKTLNYRSNVDFSHLRITLDHAEDLIVINNIIENFSPNTYFDYMSIIEYLDKNSLISLKNSMYTRK